MNGSSSTQPTQPWAPSTLTDWTQVLHNAARVPQDSPRYAEARQVVQDALSNIDLLNQTASQRDVKRVGEILPPELALGLKPVPGVDPNALLAGTVAFGRGASAGIVKPPPEIAAAHPTASIAGDIAGAGAVTALASPLVAGLSPMAGGAILGGSYGATRGAIDPMLTGDRKIDAALGGLTGLVTGAVGGKITGKLAPAVTQVGRNILKLLGARAAQTGAKVTGEELAQTNEAILRRYLEGKGMHPEQIEAAIVRSRPLWASEAAKAAPQPALAAQARPAPPPEPKLPPGKVAPLAGTEGRGFEVTGERATPAIPASAPTIGEMSGVANLQLVPRAAAEVPAPKPLATGATTRSGRSVADILREGEKVMGRPLSAAERDAVLQRLFGARSAHPGHPLWFGPGAPTE